ncbi:MAG: hypothetical protein ACRC3B_04075 [Bacteroidia bacterium]
MTTHTRMTLASAGFLLITASLALPACSEKDAPNNVNDTVISTDSLIASSAENVFYYIPSPIEMADLLRRAGANYNSELPNKSENVSRYSSSSARALNLGIYGADLSYAGIFSQNAESAMFMNCANKLAEGLRVSSAFNPSLRNRLEANMSSRDSVLSIITTAYWDCDAVLQENNQQHASALMIAGGWIEGLYLACRVAENTNNAEIRIRIAEQRFSLDKLIELLEKQNHGDVQTLVTDLKELQAVYAKLPPPADVSSTEENGITVIGGNDDVKPVSLNALEFKEIADKVKSIREKVVSRT